MDADPHDPHWCEALFAARAAGLILYGRALGLSHGEAEDVVQEVFRKLLAMPEAPRQPAHYLLRAFRNRALNHRRSLWRRMTRELESRRWFEPSDDHGPAEEAAMRHLAGLPREQREVIVLKIWHRHTFEEIGELLGISPNTASGRYRYGLIRLRAALGGTPTHEPDESTAALRRGLFPLDAAPAVGGA